MQLDIAIIGCGPGGMAAALFLDQLGHKITLYERFAEPQPIGSGLLIQPSGQEILDQLGLLNEVQRLAHPIDRLHGISLPSGKRALDMEYRFGPRQTSALGIHRANLFSTLFGAVEQSGIALRCDQKLTGYHETTDGIMPHFGIEKRTGPVFDFLVDASGARSPLAYGKIRRLPFGAFWANVDMPAKHELVPNALDQRYFHAEQMAGIMPIGLNPATGNPGAALFWSEKPETADGTIDKGIERFQENYTDLWPAAEPFVSQLGSMDELTMAVYHHRTGIAHSSRRLLFVGDSWHCTSPQLGQGANMALIDAWALAAAFESTSDSRNIGPAYDRSRTVHIKLYQWLSLIFTPLYQSDSRWFPLLRDVGIHYFARWPGIRQLIARTVSGRLGLSELI